MLSAWVLRFRKGYICINFGEKINKISCRACTQEMISMTFRGKRKGVPFSSMKNQIKHYSNILQKKDMMSHFEFIQKIKQCQILLSWLNLQNYNVLRQWSSFFATLASIHRVVHGVFSPGKK